jgi:hypothetical protein
MKYYSRLKIYKASNVTLDKNEISAYSYRWWKFLTVHNGVVVFNRAYYSSSTNRHQSKVLNEIRGDIKIDLVLRHTLLGLNNLELAIDDEINCLCRINIDLAETIKAPRTHKAKNEERKQSIAQNVERMGELKNFKTRLFSPLSKVMNS